ncbi:MAG TPA: hypothetical protein VGV61_17215, partial [Thermoanaerobaculia bacterium]|nr:hypothetical protein [Thermoanaerobaculia bacterium]
MVRVLGLALLAVATTSAATAAPGCVADATHLCLNQARFRVAATWTDFSGHSGVGTAVPLTG